MKVLFYYIDRRWNKKVTFWWEFECWIKNNINIDKRSINIKITRILKYKLVIF